jgi:tRNA (guanine6-N2)-methyltransferase
MLKNTRDRTGMRELMQQYVECVTWPGLVPALVDEIAGLRFEHEIDEDHDCVRMPLRALRDSQRLRTVQSVFVGMFFAVPRPKALLGQQYWDAIIATARQLCSEQVFTTVELDAAGSDSSVMQRIVQSLADTLGLRKVADEGELLVRIRPAPGGWEVLVRTTPRPLGARPWRVCNMPGALNAVVAASLNRWAGCYADERVLNMGVGSGTMLIERLLQAPAQQAWGCDTNPQALACAQQNMAAAGVNDRAELVDWDVTQLPMPDGSVDVVMSDLPFGQLIGTHQNNLQLYPAWLREAARVVSQRGRIVVISHEVRLLQQTVAAIPQLRVIDEMQIQVGGMHPLALLMRTTTTAD